SYRDLGQNVFAFSTGAVWDKMFKFRFVRDRQLQFQEIQNCNDTAFTLLSLALADRIAVVTECFVTYRQNNERSLVGRRDFHWNSFYAVMPYIREKLKQAGRYDGMRSAFNQIALLFCFWVLDNLKEPIRSIGYKDFLTNGLKDIVDSVPLALRDRLRSKHRRCLSKPLADFFSRRPDKIVPVVFSAQNADVPYLGVAIQSIMENGSPDYFYDIYVLHRTIGAPAVRRLEGLTRGNSRICCIDVSAFVPPGEAGPYLWSVLPRVLFQYPKVICLSPLVLVRMGLEKLLRQKMSGRVLAGAPLCMTADARKDIARETGLNPDAYVDPAVLLVDFAKLSAIQELPGSFTPHRINLFFAEKIAKLDAGWNMPAQIFLPHVLKRMDLADMQHQRNFYPNIRIFSFESLGGIHQHHNIVSTLWWECARRSPFYEELIFREVGR
ncbi:MAG: hypothetical protein PHX68_03720, partial [Alphaproteobacteria bacterium]|nr:hypothetical protein [Alphaproteobacteria bacterium]